MVNLYEECIVFTNTGFQMTIYIAFQNDKSFAHLLFPFCISVSNKQLFTKWKLIMTINSFLKMHFYSLEIHFYYIFVSIVHGPKLHRFSYSNSSLLVVWVFTTMTLKVVHNIDSHWWISLGFRSNKLSNHICSRYNF